MQELPLISGADPARELDALFVNAPLPRRRGARLGITQTAKLVNTARPRWAAMNLLAPPYEMSARIAENLDPCIALMVGGHHAKACGKPFWPGTGHAQG